MRLTDHHTTLDLSRRGRPLLERLGLLDRCSVVNVGPTLQNARLDDRLLHDHA